MIIILLLILNFVKIYFCAVEEKERIRSKITDGEKLDGNSMIEILNSSTCITRTKVIGKENGYTVDVNGESILEISNCIFVFEKKWHGIIVNEGKVIIKKVDIQIFNEKLGSICEECCKERKKFGLNRNMEITENSVILKDLTIRNKKFLMEYGSIAIEGGGNMECVENCLFENISRINDKEIIQKEKKGELFLSCVKNSIIHSVEDWIYGVGIKGINEKGRRSIGCYNCSFSKDFRSEIRKSSFSNYISYKIDFTKDSESKLVNSLKRKDIYPNNFTVRDTTYTETKIADDNCIFLTCTFNECNATIPEKNDGGGIYMNECYNLNVTDCNFNNCSAKRFGGAIFCENVKNLNIDNSNFRNCEANDDELCGGGGIYLKGVSECCALKGCTFERCTGRSCGGIYLTSSSSSSLDACSDSYDKGILLSCSFVECISFNDDGGGIIFDTKNVQSIRECTFKKCLSNGYGGGFVFKSSKSNNEGNKQLFFSLIFERNSAKYGGRDVYILDLDNTCLVSPFQDCSSVMSGGNRCIKNNGSLNVLDEWIPSFVLEVDISGRDELYCGESGKNRCKTLHYAVNLGTENGDNNIKITSQTLSENESSIIGYKEYIIEGEDKEITSVEIGEDFEFGKEKGVFVVNNGKLSCTKWSILVKRKLGNGPVILLSGKDGKINLKEFKISEEESITDETEGFIVVMEGEAMIEECLFQGLHCSSKTRSTIAIENDANVFIEGTTIEGCKNNEGNGGAIKGEIQKGGRIEIGSSSDIILDSCTSQRGGGVYLDVGEEIDGFELKKIEFRSCSATEGNKIFVVSSDLKQISKKLGSGENPLLTSETLDKDIMGSERSDGEVFPLVLGLRKFEDAAILDVEGEDTPFCGFSDTPCKTFEGAFSVQEENERKVAVKTNAEINNVLLLSYGEYIIKANEIGVSCVKMEKEGRFENSVNTTFTGFKVEIGSEERIGLAFFGKGGKLRIQICIITCVGNIINDGIIEMNGGSIEVKNITFEWDNNIEMGKSPFVLNGTKEADYLLMNCSLSKINLNNGNGGGIRAVVEETQWLLMENVTIKECSVSAGQGGGMWLKLFSEEGLMIEEGVLIEECSALEGNNLFIITDDLERVANSLYKTKTLLTRDMDEKDVIGSKTEDGESAPLISLVEEEPETKKFPYLWIIYPIIGFVVLVIIIIIIIVCVVRYKRKKTIASYEANMVPMS